MHDAFAASVASSISTREFARSTLFMWEWRVAFVVVWEELVGTQVKLSLYLKVKLFVLSSPSAPAKLFLNQML